MNAADGPHVLTAGETMALLDPTGDGAIALGAQFRLRVAGAESNFGIALRRLGVPVVWVSRIGTDALGDVVWSTLDDEGLDLRYARRDPAPTGVFFKRRSGERTNVLYYRRGSAASRLQPTDVPDAAFDGAALVHLTGITMALSDSARRTVVDVARRARYRGIPVLFDPNYRPSLWTGPQAAAEAHVEVLGYVDWYLCGADEGNILWGSSDAESLIAALGKVGIDRAVVRTGTRAALLHDRGAAVEVMSGRLEEVRDEIGAGDGFAAGFAYGLIGGWSCADCVRAGHALAARALRGTGDWETFPYLAEISEELRGLRSHDSSIGRHSG